VLDSRNLEVSSLVRRVFRCLFVALPLLSSVAASAQPPVMRELIDDVATVERKVVALANAVPAETYAWRPAEGVRSIGEVLVHIGGDNYFLPALASFAAPPDTGINGKDFATSRGSRRDASRATRSSPSSRVLLRT
jgi:hypothetical protein